MKNLFKSKKIHTFLLTMIMIVSLFFFSACGEEDEKILFKIVYRPYASSFCPGETFKTYKTVIKENIMNVSENILTRTVGAFGIGELEFEQADGSIITLKPELDDNYYTNLLGVSDTSRNYEEVVSTITRTTNIIYLSGSGSNNILVLSNYQVTSSMISNFVSYNEEDKEFIAQTGLTELSNNRSYSYGESLNINSIYMYNSGDDFSFVFVGDYAYSSSNSFNVLSNARIYVTKILSTNYNNIQQTVSRVDMYDGVDVSVTAAKWKFSLEDNELVGIQNAEEYLNAYKEKYNYHFAVELANAILTRSESKLSEDLQNLYEKATRSNSSNTERENFIDSACNYIDHLGLIEEEIESLSKFFLNTAIGTTISDRNELLAESCKKLLTETLNDVGTTPLLEVLSYKGSELNDIKIDGYIQSIIMLREDDSYDFSLMYAFFETNENQEIIPYDITVRHQEKGDVVEYPIAVDENDLKDGCLFVDMSEVLNNNKESIRISKCSDPIKAGLLSKVTSIVEKAEEYKNKFIYSTSTKNTDGMSWCFNDEDSNFIEITFGYNSLCTNQQMNLSLLMF